MTFFEGGGPWWAVGRGPPFTTFFEGVGRGLDWRGLTSRDRWIRAVMLFDGRVCAACLDATRLKGDSPYLDTVRPQLGREPMAAFTLPSIRRERGVFS